MYLYKSNYRGQPNRKHQELPNNSSAARGTSPRWSCWDLLSVCICVCVYVCVSMFMCACHIHTHTRTHKHTLSHKHCHSHRQTQTQTQTQKQPYTKTQIQTQKHLFVCCVFCACSCLCVWGGRQTDGRLLLFVLVCVCKCEIYSTSLFLRVCVIACKHISVISNKVHMYVIGGMSVDARAWQHLSLSVKIELWAVSVSLSDGWVCTRHNKISYQCLLVHGHVV